MAMFELTGYCVMGIIAGTVGIVIIGRTICCVTITGKEGMLETGVLGCCAICCTGIGACSCVEGT